MEGFSLDEEPTLSKQRERFIVIRNVIFDWSGTLVDDLPAVWAASSHIFEQSGVAPLTLERFRQEFELPWEPFFKRHVPQVSRERLYTLFVQRYAEVQDSIVPLPHAQAFLEFCQARSLRTFVLSAVMPDMYARQAASTGFGAYIARPYLGVMDKRQRILEILADNALHPEETVFIGDMQHDIETAKHGGIASVAVLTGYNSLDQLRSASPDLIVEHLGELKRVLDRNGMHLKSPPNSPSSGCRHPIATVGALIFNDAGEVLLLQTNKWSNRWGIPGGKIEWGESSEDALRRELLEETGLEVHSIRFVLVQDAIHPPEFYRDAHFLLLNYTCIASGQQTVRLNSEAQQFRWVPLVDAFKFDLNQPTRVLLEAVAAA